LEDFEKIRGSHMNYIKVTKDDVYKIIVNNQVAIMCPIKCVNLVNIANILKTSRYQVKKCIEELKADGLIELTFENVSNSEELYPPYWGYTLTAKGIDTEYYREAEKKERELFEKCFK
jgi:Mn-dependent DtxR family transcriptional regulator